MTEVALLDREAFAIYPSIQTRLSSCEAELTAWTQVAAVEGRSPSESNQINMRMQLSTLALASGPGVDEAAFAAQIATFHAEVDEHSPIRAVFDYAFESAMGKLAGDPAVLAELLKRNENADNGWRPFNEREERLLEGWRDRVKYLGERETTEKIERAAGFAGSLLSQGLKRRDHLRRQGSGFAQSYSSVFPEVPCPRSED
jgi:hypothetical protein